MFSTPEKQEILDMVLKHFYWPLQNNLASQEGDITSIIKHNSLAIALGSNEIEKRINDCDKTNIFIHFNGIF